MNTFKFKSMISLLLGKNMGSLENILLRISLAERKNGDINIKFINRLFAYVGGGYSSEVYKRNKYCIKFFKKRGRKCDAEILEQLEGLGNIPKLHYKHNNFMITEFVEGETLAKFVEKNNFIPNKLNNALEEILAKIIRKDMLPLDITAHNVIYDEVKDSFIIIDVGMFELIDYDFKKEEDLFISCTIRDLNNSLKKYINKNEI